jgi:hypothetical protein
MKGAAAGAKAPETQSPPRCWSKADAILVHATESGF